MRRVCAALCSILALTVLSYAANHRPKVRTGLYRGHKVTYLVVNGRNIYQGDIILEHVDQPDPSKPRNPGIGIVYPANQWPKVGGIFEIPYTITQGSQNVIDSIAAFNSTFSGFMQWVPRTTETDYADFNLDPNDHSGVCESSVGRVGGKQELTGSIDCTNMLHEMGHAVGLWHEQSRSDRNSFVSINYANIIKLLAVNFDMIQDNGQDVGLYDFASDMQYSSYIFTKNGQPTIETIPAGISLSSASPNYSAGDIDTIRRIYGGAPTAVTVTSNPVGLQLTVDGTPITTPQIFNWALNSTHTLSAPTTVQTVNSTPYIYGRWNDSMSASHTITVAPGNNLVAQPASSPAVTVYSANFIMLVPYSPSVFPAGTGTLNSSPSAQSFPGGTGVYFTARQPVTLTATPNAGQNFYAFINSPYWLRYSLSVNPKAINVPDDGNPMNLQALFTSAPVYTITTNLTDPGAGIILDGNVWYAPKNASSAYDSGFTSGSTHSISTFDPQEPWSTTFRYPFQSWSDGGALTHNITLPAASATYTASFGAQYELFDFVNQPCAATLNVSPPSPTGDGFYPQGTQLTFTETPNAGWIFTGWQHDLTGTQNPINLTAEDEMYVTADYNTVSTPISVSSLSPPSAVAGSGGFTLTINGAGFSSSSVVFVNNTFRTSTFVNSTTLTVPITSSDLATPGGFQIFVENFPTGASCAAYSTRTFYVLLASGATAGISPSSLNFGSIAAGTTSASQAITLSNGGSGALSITSIVASGDFSQTNNCGGSLAGGGSCTVNVTFSPRVSGAVSGAVTFTDGVTTSPQLVTLSGSGVLPVTFKPAKLSFGSVSVGHSSSKTVTLTNNQTTAISLAPTPSADYSVTGGTCGSSLAAGAKCTIAVTFTPASSGTIQGALAIATSGALSPEIFALTGTATGGPAVPLSFSPATLSFSKTGVGATSAAKTVTVTNTSAGSVTITGLTGSAAFAAAGSGATPCGGVLAASAKCTFSVTFTPPNIGSIKGSVAVATSATGSPQVMTTNGTAVAPVALSPTSVAFGNQAVGTTSAAKTVTLTNNSGAALTISSIAASGDFAATPSGSKACESSLAAGGKCTFSVTFTPNVAGAITGAVTVTHNAPLGPAVIKLTGTGQ